MDVRMARWSSDGRFIFFTGNADGPYSAYRIVADGTGKAELLFSRAEWWINDVSPRPDGSGVLIAAQQLPGHDIFFVREGSQEAEPFLVTPSDERQPAFSPNGAFVAYVSNESGRREVYVRPFPGPGPKRQVSTNGGTSPQWSRDGREIFYFEVGQAGVSRRCLRAGERPSS
jgi:serine/threonine-protein kinase